MRETKTDEAALRSVGSRVMVSPVKKRRTACPAAEEVSAQAGYRMVTEFACGFECPCSG